MMPLLTNNQTVKRGSAKQIIIGILPLVQVSLILSSCGGTGVADSMVRVYSENLTATGIIVDKAGYIVCGAQAVSGADSISVELKPGTSFGGRVVCIDSARDIAVIKMEGTYPALKPVL
jgi:S1-C subfamily serine protease